MLDKWLEYQKGAATYKGAIEVDFTLHRAIVKLEALLKRFAEEGAVTNMDYGSGAGGTGWSHTAAAPLDFCELLHVDAACAPTRPRSRA